MKAEREEPPPGTRRPPVDERERVRRNLEVIQTATLVGAVVGALSHAAMETFDSATVLAIGAVSLALPMWLRRRDRLQLSAAVFCVLLVSVIHALCSIGRGVQDTAAILYPVAIVGAALMLDLGLLVAITLACITSVVSLLRQQPGPTDWGAAADVSIILSISAVAAYLLLRDVVHGAAEARSKEQRLAQAYGELEARTAELERFTHVVSHDLRSPLVSIRGFLDYVEQDARSGDLGRLAEDVQRIRAASDRMGQLLDDLLELSRTGRIARAHEDVPFGEVVREARALVHGRLSARCVQVEVCDDAAGRVVRGDRARLVELVQNLLDNAAKFIGDQPSPRVEIDVRDAPDGSGPVFSVRDNGLGIDAAHHESVFELFRQLDPRQEGTGLGLALGRRIVETHGGHLWVESEGVGRGSTFYFTLHP